ncbi:hypothetical protein CALCODRAFT_481486 [Calocera cornea HHB12733]|uniref:Uncharacterized protein n=1 Tax=Calocera cornea HHB12733 TaxID=1353952 RepID=A0A165HQB8_9BASI|nr:hypothetical protein CALCODRAFT_481486 [Calocera cornea HHB12733]
MFFNLLSTSPSSRNSMAAPSSPRSASSSASPVDGEPKRRSRLFKRHKAEGSQSMEELPMPNFPSSPNPISSPPPLAPLYLPRPASLFVDRPEDVQEALARLRDSPYSASQGGFRTVPRVALHPSASSAGLGSASSNGSYSSDAYSYLPDQEEDEALPPPSQSWPDEGQSRPTPVRPLPPLPHSASSASLLLPSSAAYSRPTRSRYSSSSALSAFSSPEPPDFLTPVERRALRRRYDDATLGMAPWELGQSTGSGSYYFQ